MSKKYSYVGGPYTHKDSSVQDLRGEQHCKYSAELLTAGHLVYSPIAETMMLAKYGHMVGTSWETWREKDIRQLSMHDEMIILPLDGWEESIGLRAEIKYCIQHKIPMSVFDLDLKVVFPVSNKDLLFQLGVTKEAELND